MWLILMVGLMLVCSSFRTPVPPTVFGVTSTSSSGERRPASTSRISAAYITILMVRRSEDAIWIDCKESPVQVLQVEADPAFQLTKWRRYAVQHDFTSI